jgi:hypothetical protein
LHTKPDIIYLLLWHLNQYKWFELPGVGYFTGFDEKAFVDHIGGRIYPSKLTVSFNENSSERVDELIQNLVAETGYNASELESELTDLIFYLKQELKDKAEVDFKPFGKLTKHVHGIQFQAYSTNLNSEFFGMTGLPLKAINQETYKIQQTLYPPIKPLVKNGLSEHRNLLWLLGLLWFIFLGLLFWPSLKSCNKSNKNNKPIESQSKLKDSIDAAQKKREDSILAAQHQNRLLNQKEDSINNIINRSKYIKDSIESLQAELKLKTIKDSITAVNEINTKLKNEEIIQENNLETLNKRVKHKKCIIIIGSFKNKKFANQIAKKVQKDGYIVYRGKHGEYNRVGIQFECMTKDLQIVLAELKSKYHPQSWVLKY